MYYMTKLNFHKTGGGGTGLFLDTKENYETFNKVLKG